MEERKKQYALISLISSMLLGLAFIILFLWKAPGISHLLFYLLSVLAAVVPVYIVENKEAGKRFGSKTVIALALFALSTVFIYRLKVQVIIISFITLPVLYSIALTAVFMPKLFSRISVLGYFALPMMLCAAWFADIIGFVKNLSFSGIKSEKTRSYIKRGCAALFISLPFLLFFLILMVSADAYFSDQIQNFLDQTLYKWFKDFESFVEFCAKLLIGFIVAVYYMIFNFSLWNKDSKLAQFVEDYVARNGRDMKKSWDVFKASVFLGMLNLLFFFFIIVQFRYLLGGIENVIGENAGYTYAEYARRGFGELLVIATFVYAIVFILNFKVYLANKTQQIIFRANYVFLTLSAVILTISSHKRLYLVESTYGFTNTRLFGHYITVILLVLLGLLLLSAFMKNAYRFMSVTTAIVIFVSYVGLIVVPTDYFVANLNVSRYEETGELDLPYLLNLSDEAIPVLVDLAEETDSETLEAIIKSDLYGRSQAMQDSRKEWQSFNLWNEYNKALLGDDYDKDLWSDKATDSLQDFLLEYAELMESEMFEEAYDKYWTSTATKSDNLDDLVDINIISYDFNYLPVYEELRVLNYANENLGFGSSTNVFDYWNGEFVYADVKFTFFDDTGLLVTRCNSDSLRVKLENGEWRIQSASTFNLGNFTDSEGVEQVDSLNLLIDDGIAAGWSCY